MIQITEDTNHPQLTGKISSKTLLSFREAELYVLKVKFGHTLDDCAEKMGIGNGTAYSTWNRIKEKIEDAPEKIQRAEETAKLELP